MVFDLALDPNKDWCQQSPCRFSGSRLTQYTAMFVLAEASNVARVDGSKVATAAIIGSGLKFNILLEIRTLKGL